MIGEKLQNKQLGTIFEAAFAYHALCNGCEVFLSQGEFSVVDAVVISPMDQLFRVQIRGTAKQKGVSISPPTGRGANTKPLDQTKYEVLAVYAHAYRIWYLIPSAMVAPAKTLKIYPMFPESRGQYEIYRDNWKIFK